MFYKDHQRKTGMFEITQFFLLKKIEILCSPPRRALPEAFQGADLIAKSTPPNPLQGNPPPCRIPPQVANTGFKTRPRVAHNPASFPLASPLSPSQLKPT
jgi:hypothetical protein